MKDLNGQIERCSPCGLCHSDHSHYDIHGAPGDLPVDLPVGLLTDSSLFPKSDPTQQYDFAGEIECNVWTRQTLTGQSLHLRWQLSEQNSLLEADLSTLRKTEVIYRDFQIQKF